MCLSGNEIADAVVSLRERGWWLAPRGLSEERLVEFERFCIEVLKAEHPEVFEGSGGRLDPIRAGNLLSGMCGVDSTTLLEQALIELLFDADVVEIARRYLGVHPVVSQLPNAWFSFPVASVDSKSAQNWHWDCDRVSWLKVFVYVTDVSSLNGPHSFIEGSHRDLAVHSKNSRYRDDAVTEAYPGKQRDFTATRGQILFEDTRGLHRGTPVREGYRLILQFEYALDHYGAASDIGPIIKRFPGLVSDDGVL